MAEILIRNGAVFDPSRGINGDVMDVAIREGRVVDSVGSDAKVIDAAGKTVMAGGV